MSSSGSQPSAASSTQPRSFHDVIHTPSLLLVNADDDCLKLQKVAEIFDYPNHADEPCPVAVLCVAALLTFFPNVTRAVFNGAAVSTDSGYDFTHNIHAGNSGRKRQRE